MRLIPYWHVEIGYGAIYLQNPGVLSVLQKRFFKLLSWFPKLSLAIICNVLPEYTPSQIVEELWELVEFSLIDQSEKGRYKAPAVVSSTYQRRSIEHDLEILGRVSQILTNQFESGELDFDLV